MSREAAHILYLKETKMRSAISDTGGVVRTLGELPAGAILDEKALARAFGRCRRSVQRAVQRGELPPPVRLFGRPSWTVGTILEHVERRLEEARRTAEADARRLTAHAV